MSDIDHFNGQPRHDPLGGSRHTAPPTDATGAAERPGGSWDRPPDDAAPRRGRRRRNDPDELDDPQYGQFPPDAAADMRPRGRRHRRPSDPADSAPLTPVDGTDFGHAAPRSRRRRDADPEPDRVADPTPWDPPAWPPDGDARDPRERRDPRSAHDPRDARGSRTPRNVRERESADPPPSRRGGRGSGRSEPQGRPTPARRAGWDDDQYDQYDEYDQRDEASLGELGLGYGDDADHEDHEDHEGEEPIRDRRHMAERRRAEMELRSGRGKKKRKRTRKRKRGRIFAPAVALVILGTLVLGGGGAGYLALRAYFAPPDFEGQGSGEVQVVVNDGDTGEAIGETLEEAGVVASVRAFTNELRGEDASDFRPGTYLLRGEMSASAAVAMLLDPNSRVASQVTIREGLRVSQIFAAIENDTGIPVAELEAAAENPEALGLPDYADGTLEGYLHPETYTVEPDTDAEDVLVEMVERHIEVAEEMDLEERAEEEGFTPQEIMSMAAVIQAESGNVGDMPLISQVIYNRLEIEMDLQMDSTCFYVLGEFGIALTNDQLRACREADSDYATYGRGGLPVGPIVSPGQDAITAALEPTPGDFLFFVATDPENGVTEFAETEQEFEVLKQRFEENRGDL